MNQTPISKKWSEDAWMEAQCIYDAILAHPFVKELTDGSLPAEKFSFYLQQDALYLEQYSSALAHIASRLSDKDQVESFLGFARDGIEVEKAMHEVFLSDIKDRIRRMSPSCLLYTSVIKSQRSMPVEVEAAAVLPCFWIYLKVGQEIHSRQDGVTGNPYAMWIDTYSDQTFAESTERAIAICDALAQKASPEIRAMMTEIFTLCTRMEWMFWNSAYNLEQWTI